MVMLECVIFRDTCTLVVLLKYWSAGGIMSPLSFFKSWSNVRMWVLFDYLFRCDDYILGHLSSLFVFAPHKMCLQYAGYPLN